MARLASAASSFTAKHDFETGASDAESQHARNDVPHSFLVFHPSGTSDAVINHDYPGQGTAESPYVVEFLPEDASNPLQYPARKKWAITGLLAVATMAVAFASTAYSGGVFEIIVYFQTSTTMAVLGVSLFVLGFAVGPLLWAPLSGLSFSFTFEGQGACLRLTRRGSEEYYGRQIIFFLTYFGLVVFSAGAACAQNIESLVILRFFAGAFGASPITNSGGVIADMFNAKGKSLQPHRIWSSAVDVASLLSERGLAACLYLMAPFLGPSIGPIVGGFLVGKRSQKRVSGAEPDNQQGETEGWRWIEGLTAIFAGVLWVACSLYVPETYAPVLLRRRAAKLSSMTGKIYVSKLDLAATVPRSEEIKTALLRPWILLFREPIVLLASVYLAILYGTLYLLFAAYPVVFQLNRGWSAGTSGLAFVGVAVGMLFAVVYFMGDNAGRYQRVAAASVGGVAPPEARLPPAILGSVLLPVGLFWFAWTNGPEVHWVVPILASTVFAAGLVVVFLALLTYLLDSYTVFAASAMAASAVLRSLFGAAFPLFTPYMYQNLGIHWASMVPAFLALACTPVPLLFYWYGARIRSRCRYAAEAAEVLRTIQAAHELGDASELKAPERVVLPGSLPGSLPVSQSRLLLGDNDRRMSWEVDGEDMVETPEKLT